MIIDIRERKKAHSFIIYELLFIILFCVHPAVNEVEKTKPILNEL